MATSKKTPATAKTPAAKTPAAKATAAKATKPTTAASGSKLVVGQKAPDFTLPSGDGREISLSDFRGKHVIVYFYPRDDTPGCTREAQGFEAATAQVRERDAIVLGVSKDSVESHQRFCTKYALRFPLLSDRDAKVIDAYGAWGEKNMYGKKSMGIVRTTVLVGPDGKVKRVFPKVKVDGHVDAVIASIDASDA
ncbi:MAG: thioredoxin-dependent thiol peroxidase [Myxococcota bacterium]|nr:thioredoxin-dependent thiol peroxidase [Myxococcota bacterium]